MPFTKIFEDVEAHGKTILTVIYTNDENTVAQYIEGYKQYLETCRDKIIGVDVEYTNEKEPYQKAVVVQLSVGKYQPVLLYQVCAAVERCYQFDEFLNNPRYTFAGFCIDQDKEKLGRSKLKIADFVNIQQNWRVPEGTKPLDSLGYVSAIVIDDYYKDMKNKITNEEHKRWDWILSRRHIEYAAKDAYTAFEIWSHITTIQDGLSRAKAEQNRKRHRTWGESTWGDWN